MNYSETILRYIKFDHQFREPVKGSAAAAAAAAAATSFILQLRPILLLFSSSPLTNFIAFLHLFQICCHITSYSAIIHIEINSSWVDGEEEEEEEEEEEDSSWGWKHFFSLLVGLVVGGYGHCWAVIGPGPKKATTWRRSLISVNKRLTFYHSTPQPRQFLLCFLNILSTHSLTQSVSQSVSQSVRSAPFHSFDWDFFFHPLNTLNVINRGGGAPPQQQPTTTNNNNQLQINMKKKKMLICIHSSDFIQFAYFRQFDPIKRLRCFYWFNFDWLISFNLRNSMKWEYQWWWNSTMPGKWVVAERIY